MRTYAVAFLGFGNVATALVRLLESRNAELAARYGVAWRPAGVATRRLGWWANSDGLDLTRPERSATRCYDVGDWLLTARPDVVIETIALAVGGFLWATQLLAAFCLYSAGEVRTMPSAPRRR